MTTVDSDIDNTPRGMALRLVEELTAIIPQGQLLPEDIKAYDAFYTRVEAQPEPVRWLFAFELQYIISNMVEAFRQAPDDQKALMTMCNPENLRMDKHNLEFIHKTLGNDTCFRARYLRDAFNNLPDKHVANPINTVKIYCDDKCPLPTSGNISSPVSP